MLNTRGLFVKSEENKSMEEVKTLPWFYAPELPEKGEVTLSREEARHTKTQRIKKGQKISLFDGKGRIAIGELSNDDKVNILSVQSVQKSEFSITIAVAVPKGERADWMMQKLTEIGVDKIIPLHTKYSVVLPREAKQERWKRILIEACKQSKRAWLPELKPLSTIEQALQEKADLKLWLDQAGKPVREVLQKPASTIAFIGPEGGFNDEEKALLKNAGCIPVSLGENILRIETAAICISAAARFLNNP